MFAFLTDPFLKVSGLPYSEIWLPLIIGAGIGLTFLVVARKVLHHTPELPPLGPVRDMGDPFEIGSPTEQRKAFRRNGNPIPVLYALPDNRTRPNTGWVYDRSIGGLGMITKDELAEGVLLVVRPANAPEMAPWTEVEVRSCRPSKDDVGFEVGCKFLKTPPWSILLLFG